MRLIRNALVWLGVLSATLLLLEGATRAASRAGLLEILPALPETYWWGSHPEFGIWRRPEARLEHVSACFQAEYRSNSHGARDVERPLGAEGRRIVVLGDSFLAGWGLAAGQRVSNRLEGATGLPHLNFAMPHFSAYQSYLAYRELAKRFDHDAVVLGLLPANDFVDQELALAERVPGSYLYRPYLVGTAPDYTRRDHRETRLRRWLRHHSYAFAGWLAAEMRVRERRLAANPILRPPGKEVDSWFYDYAESQVALLEAPLRRLLVAAEGRPVVVVLIPTVFDIQRFRSVGTAPLAGRLRKTFRDTPLFVVDLLPALAKRVAPPEELYFPCDYHWNAAGNLAATRLLREALIGRLY